MATITKRNNGCKRKARTAKAWAVVDADGYIDTTRISASHLIAAGKVRDGERACRVKIEETH